MGGPLDGQERDIPAMYLRKTFSWPTGEPEMRQWGGKWVEVTPWETADYARWPDGTWRHVRTPLTIGDNELEDEQLGLEETA